MSASVGGTRVDPAVRDGARGYVDTGWLTCASILLVVSGAFNILHGLVALNQSEYLVNQVLFGNLDAWGWTFLVWGVLQAVAGAVAIGGATWARMLGVGLGTFACLLWFVMIFAAPFAALAGIVVNVMVIYGMSTTPPRSV
jgi:hypothetical protein